jgi:hypothetical protein
MLEGLGKSRPDSGAARSFANCFRAGYVIKFKTNVFRKRITGGPEPFHQSHDRNSGVRITQYKAVLYQRNPMKVSCAQSFAKSLRGQPEALGLPMPRCVADAL